AGSGAVIAFLLAALLCVPVALAYAELSSAFPLTGAEYTFLGRILGPAWGFMALGLNIVGGALTQAVTALGLAAYLGVAIAGTPPLPTALAAVGLSSLVAILNVRVNALVTGLFLATEIAALGAMTALGLAHPHPTGLQALLHPVMVGPRGAFLPASLAVIGLATTGAVYAYNGFGAAVSFGEELREAPRKIAAVVLWSLVIAALSEAVPITATILGAPDLKAMLAAPSPASAFIATGGVLFAKAVSLGVAAAIVNAMIATALSNARQLYATARDEVWPPLVNRAFGATHRRFRSPWIATLVTGAFAAAACLLGLRLLVIFTATGIVVTYAGVCASVLVGRWRGSTAHGLYRMPWFPWPAILALVALAAMILADLADPDVGRISLAATLAIMVFFAAYYWFFTRPRGGWRLRGPGGELSMEDAAP
ncbi:MAG: APC family permease, partial [Caulobacteraceae bacterium]